MLAGVLPRAIEFLDDRLGFSVLRDLLEHKRVPTHRHTVWYYTGGFTLFLFGVQVFTGILLLLYYRPTAAEAFESVQFIVTAVPFGWLIRSAHSWSANLMVFSLHVHLFAVLFLKAYRRPRELTWLTGVALFGLTLVFGFSGYLLPWNQLSFFATRVGTDVPAVVPVIGPFVVEVLRGGKDVTGATLTRFFGLHVAILPAVTTMVLGLHLLLIQRHGMSLPPSIERERERPGASSLRSLPFYPHFMLRESMAWLVGVALLAALSAFFPWELGAKADAFASAPAGIKPEWFFLWMFQTLKVLPSHILGLEGEMLGVIGFSVLGAILLLVPFLEGPPPERRRSRLIGAGAGVVLVFMVTMTVWAYVAAKAGGAP